MSTLPCLGKLPELEELSFWRMKELKFVGRELFLGIVGDTDVGTVFRKLAKLNFYDCPQWEKWEDITAKAEGSATVAIMPCLRELRISYCGLMELPHRLLRKASWLEELRLDYSFHLWEHYGEKGSSRRSLSHIPRLLKQSKSMADAMITIVLDRLADVLQKQIKEEVNLVRGVKKEVQYLSSELDAIRTVLEDADRRGYKEKTVQNWLKRLEDVSYDIDDVLDEWNYVLLKLQIEGSEDLHLPMMKVCPFVQSSCLCFNKVATRRDIAKKIKGLKERLAMIVKKKNDYDFIVNRPVHPRESARVQSVSLVDLSEIHGREADKDVLVGKLVLGVVGQQLQVGPQVISIVGVGGIGKTTLAQLEYNDDRLVNCFELKIWVCVSDIFDEVRIAKAIIEMVTGSSSNLNELEALLNYLKDSISGKRFLLVLDDVWTEDHTKWEPLKNSLKFGGRGSKILVTTRSERVARMMCTTEIHHLGQLSNHDCWLLMKHIAFDGRSEEEHEELQEISEKIANKCKGLPLAAKVLGSLLRFKDTKKEWENVLDSEIWQLEEAEVELFPHLFLSYNELSPVMKRCFSYCAIFPKDWEIDVEKLIRMWIALGYLSSTESTGEMELRGEEYFNNLRMRSLFQNFVEYKNRVYCKMHDIVHDFAKFLKNTYSHDLDGREEASKDGSLIQDPSLVSQVKVYRSLFCHDEVPCETFDFITCLRVLSLCAHWRGQGIPKGMENLIHLRYLDVARHRIARFLPNICMLYNLQTLYLDECWLEEIPKEIGNLIHLRHLHLSGNSRLEELPETICNLQDLQTLNLASCVCLSKLPEGIDRLVNLKHLPNDYTQILYTPQGFQQLTGLQTLRLFHAGRGSNKLGYLKRLDQLSGSLELRISVHHREDVNEARTAELRNKIHMQRLKIWFINEMGGTDSDEEELVINEVMEALQPPPNLRHLTIRDYKGTKFPGWSTSSLNHLRVIEIQECDGIPTLPCLGKLPRLEELSVWRMRGFEFLGREFLGIADGSMPFGFPKLKKLSFCYCPSWEKWEDITAKDEGNATLSVMPCLRELSFEGCRLSELPHRLLRKASSLQHLTVRNSFYLSLRYEEKNTSGWESLSHIPHVEVDRSY
ncbi:putative disease resistance protein RGA1 [Sesamum alatum]|uniref:Disease resistance protein RGA1 n=1 Tax=Sesamum alatum TaxID=300844 RepID=A0AAE1YCK9_9LAMI|nr:putative disease resistance protein RGA1 [Sesamum alatum]